MPPGVWNQPTLVSKVGSAGLPRPLAIDSLTQSPRLGLRVSMWGLEGKIRWARGAVCPWSQHQGQEVSPPDRNFFFCISK